MNNANALFRSAILETGLTPPPYIEPGKVYRFPGLNKSSSNLAGWCLLFEDGLGGCFGDWSTGLHQNWHLQGKYSLGRADSDRLKKAANAARLRNQSKRDMLATRAAKSAVSIWNASLLAPKDFPYLTRKKIKSHGARLYHSVLVLPVVNFLSQLSSLQFIEADGTKRLLKGGRKKGAFIPVNRLTPEPKKVVICEGWATGCSLAENSPNTQVLAAIDAGNLKPVAMLVRQQWPAAELIVAGDDDRLNPDNPGATQARLAASAAGALLALPQWPADAPLHLSDFNDLAVWLAGGVV